MKHNLSQRLIAMLLVVATLIGLLAVPASAASLANSGSVKITMNGFGNYLSKKSGGTIGGGYWQYTSNDGLTGAAYCINWGLTGVSPSKSLTIQPYNRNPQTMGAFANGYPARTLEQFKQLHANDVRGITNLTETEYKYATQVAVWATCGQIAVPGTKFTAGRTSVVEPTADARQIRIYDSIKRILGHAENWDKTLYLGMYLHTEENSNIKAVEIVNDRGLEGAAAAQENGIKKETINGKEYFTRVMYLDSATSTWIDGYKTKVYSPDAPSGTIFVAANNSPLETVEEGGITYYKVDTSRGHDTNLNANGYAYGGAFKVCMVRSFPICGRCAIQRDCKVRPIECYKKTLSPGTVQYIGIAKNEQDRLLQLDGARKISLLDKYNFTEQDAKKLCLRAGLLSPVYGFTDRGGCWFCPNAKRAELRHLYDHHPDLWARMLALQAIPGKTTEKFNRTQKFSDIDALFRQEDEDAAQAA